MFDFVKKGSSQPSSGETSERDGKKEIKKKIVKSSKKRAHTHTHTQRKKKDERFTATATAARRPFELETARNEKSVGDAIVFG